MTNETKERMKNMVKAAANKDYVSFRKEYNHEQRVRLGQFIRELKAGIVDKMNQKK